jgi:hypothetical protein
MFFKECARLAEQHPDLASVFVRLDSQFSVMRTAEVIRPCDLASFLKIDQNQVRSALDILTREEFLLRVQMVECAYCQMAVLRSDYQEALEEYDEYRCTDCDRPLTDKTIQIITAYRSGQRWQPAARAPERSSSTISPATLLESKWYGHSELAEAYGVGSEALRKRLDRHREHHLGGWKENKERLPREPQYLYRLRDVKSIIDDLRASSERPAK